MDPLAFSLSSHPFQDPPPSTLPSPPSRTPPAPILRSSYVSTYATILNCNCVKNIRINELRNQIAILTLTSPIHTNVTYPYQPAEAKRICSRNKNILFFIRYKFE